MHPKSFVSNFWGAVQQLMQWLFLLLFAKTHSIRIGRYKYL